MRCVTCSCLLSGPHCPWLDDVAVGAGQRLPKRAAWAWSPLVVRMRSAPVSGDRGSVTAEFAIVLTAVALILAVLLNAISVGVTHARCLDAARVAAHALAIGEDDERARQIAEQLAGSRVEVAVSQREGQVRVRVSGAGTGIFAAVKVGGEADVVAQR